MASKTEIFNSALIKIGEDVISSPTENSKPARTISAQYDAKRRQLLRSYRWNFAMTRTNLAPEEDAPAFGFTYKFLLPDDSVSLVGIYDESELSYQINYTAARIPHKVEGGYILSDENPLFIFYIKDVTTTGLFDPLFSEALAWLLAAECAIALTNDPKKLTAALDGFKASVKEARTQNAIVGTPEQFVASEWLESRLDTGTAGPYRIGPVVGY